MIDELLSQSEINALLSGNSGLGEGSATGNSGALSSEQRAVLEDIANIFSSSAASVFGMLAGKEVTAHVRQSEAVSQEEMVASVEEAPFVFRVQAGGLDNAPITVLATVKCALTLADLMMGGEGKELPEEAGELYLNAAQEGLSQVIGAAFTSMSSLLGGKRLMPENVASSLEEGEWLPFSSLDAAEMIWRVYVTLEIEGLGSFPLDILFPLDMAKSVADEVHAIVADKPQPEQPAPQPDAHAPAAHQPAQGQVPQQHPQMQFAAMGGGPAPSFGNVYDQASVDVRPAEFVPLTQKSVAAFGGKIDLVADIPVRVTVELGRTRKNIADILSMTPGSVIELDKMAGEPVDVLVNSKLIAKGEVVVIDENFGVRITEIVTSAGRVHSL
ncbi:MAG: flagellar motor switch phosphatase FliY [Aminobacteriaceae bacterium]